MKKILSLLLALVMCLTVLTSCDVQGLLDQLKGIITPQEEVEYHIEKAESFLKNMYKDVNPVTGADYEVVGQVRVAGVAYTVTWASNSEQVKIVALENGNYLVDLNEKATEDVPYVLTATITAGNGDTATVTYNRTIPKYNVLSWDAYMAAQKGDVVLVEGIVVEMNAKSLGNSRNHLFLMDASGKGGYYVYQMDQDPAEAGVKIGMTVSVSGPIEPYSGMQEIKGGTFTIVDETIKEVKPVDITEAVTAGTVNYAEYVALAVTIKGVTLGAQDMTKDSSQYLYFNMPDAKGTQAYVRTYVTDFPTTLSKAPTAENADKAAIDKLHADHFGYTADVTGILILYSGNPYLIPMSTDCFTNLKEVTYTAEEKVDAELGSLALEETVTSDTVVDLLTVGQYYNDVTITWTSDNAELAAIADGKLSLKVPTTSTTVKVTATVTCGDVTKTKEFTIKLSMEATPIVDIIALAKTLEDKGATTAEKYIVAGIVVEVKNATYGNLYIQDAAGNRLYIYGLYDLNDVRYDKMENAPQVGDYITVLSVVGHYNEPQLKNAVLLSSVSPTTIPDANTVAGTLEDKGPTTEEKYLITGKVVEIASTKYGNLYIEDAEGNKIYIYGLYDAAGNRYDAMVTNGNAPVVGDTITVLSVIGHYNNPQLKNATVVAHTVATEEPPVENNDPTPDTELTISEAAALGASKEHNTYTEGKYYVVGTVKEVQNATYGNILIEDANGNTILVYGTYSADGKVRYDAMETKPVVGDTIKVYGIVGQFNGKAQLKNAWIIETTVGHEHDYKNVVTTKPTCTTTGLATPTCACGVTTDEVAVPMAHTLDENNLCSVCNKYVLESSALEAFGKNTKEDGATTTHGFFTIHWAANAEVSGSNKTWADGYTSSQRINFGGKGQVKPTGTTKNVIEFTVTEATTVKVWWVSAGEGRQVVVYNEAGEIILTTDVTVASNDPAPVAEFAIPAAGKYYIGSHDNKNYIFKVEVDAPEVEQGGEDTPVVSGGTADLDTLTPADPSKAENSYTDRTTAAGWVATNARSDEQSAFGDDPQILLNGKKTAVGTLVSSTLKGGIKSLSLNYGNAFSESNGVSLTINVKVNGEVVATTQLVDTTVTQNVGESFTWTLDTPVTGDFVLEIINNCPTQSTSNKDRVSLWNIAWN